MNRVPDSEYRARMRKFQANIRKAGLDAALVHGNEADCANHAGIPEYSICRSLSEYFYPAGDGSPTRLGFCACPSNGCGLVPVCGNGVREFGELCDGLDVGFHTCQFYGLGDGVMGCTGNCDATDPTNCATSMP